MIRTIIIDDEPNNIEALKQLLIKYCPLIDLIGVAENIRTGQPLILHTQPDLVFLDIEMPVMNGFLMLQQLEFKNFELVFTTAYDHYAIKAIRFSALDYLVKPIEIDELKIAVDRAEKKRAETTSANQLELLLENLLAAE